jgi:CAAX prenyl protease-like protein
VLSHLLPYVLYVAPAAVAEHLPAGARPWVDPVRVLACAAALAVAARRGRYPELACEDSGQRRGLVLAVLCGVAVALLWMPLTEVVPVLGAPRAGFRPEAAGAAAAPLLWAARLTGFVVVIPCAEELFVRSLLPRWIDAPDAWRARPVGSFTPLSAAVSVAFFAATHPEWLAALAAGALWTGLLRSTGRLRHAVLSHAVANGLLAAWWTATGDRTWW